MSIVLQGCAYPIQTDYRDILHVISVLQDPDKPKWVRMHIALCLFYDDFRTAVPKAALEAAQNEMLQFLGGGQTSDERKTAVRSIDWQQDAALIAAGVNKVAGCEVRALPYLHWWTFISWFMGIGDGQLATVVSIRAKQAKGKKLEKWEQEYYRDNKAAVDLKKRYSAQELEEQARLLAILGEA